MTTESPVINANCVGMDGLKARCPKRVVITLIQAQIASPKCRLRTYRVPVLERATSEHVVG